MKVLFICNYNMHRSKTAEELFKERFETKSAGLFNETPVSASQIKWADSVAVMEPFQVTELRKRFPSECRKKQFVCLDILDEYVYNQPELIERLKLKVDKLL